MSVPTSKDELLTAISVTFERLFEDLKQVPAERTKAREMEGHAKGTQMSVADLVAYLIGWNELVLKWLAHDARGTETDFPETGFKWNELGRLAQKFYRDYEALEYAELLERLLAAKTNIVEQIDVRTNDQLYGQTWYGKWTMGRMIQFNTSSPYANARVRLRKWKKSAVQTPSG